jgi:hypothetical protein
MNFARRWLFLLERDEYVLARLVADHSGNVTATRCVFREHDFAGPKGANRAVTGFDLDLAGKGDDVLPLRRRVITAQVIRRRRAKNNAVSRLKRGCLHVAEQIELDIEVFKVRFVI